MGNRRRQWVRRWSTEKKVYIFIITLTVCVTAIAAAISIDYAANILIEQNRQFVTEQFMTLEMECDDNLKMYKSIMQTLSVDPDVQDFSSCRTDQEAGQYNTDIYDSIQNFLSMQQNINFIAVVNKYASLYVYNGSSVQLKSDFEGTFFKIYNERSEFQSERNILFDFSDDYFRGEKYTLTAYFPIYSASYINKKQGMIVMNMDDDIFSHLQSRGSPPYFQTYVIDKGGEIVSGSRDIGEEIGYAERLTGVSGEIKTDEKLICYRQIGEWDYYLVNEVPVNYLYNDCIRMVLVLVCGMIVLIICVMSVSHRMIRKLYQPLNTVVQKMEAVSAGNLGTRIEIITDDNDSRKIMEGFNVMMNEIDALICRIKEEQEEWVRMRLNNLQSQIQPHFLYNTLECIHWQAVGCGNKELSTLVNALARYYRICLSKGEDMIPLKRELEHVKSYLVIQNMRFGNRIDLKIDVSEDYREVKIPKVILQPLVENSICHGFGTKAGKQGTIWIYAEKDGDDFYLVVDDNGKGMTGQSIEYINRHLSEFDKNIGYGVNNVNKRLELSFGSRYGLKFYKNKEAGVRVKIHLPTLVEGDGYV